MTSADPQIPTIPTDAKGNFIRPPSTFENIISSESTTFKPEAGRYCLYISWACPWANRCAIVRHMKGLQNAIQLVVVHPTWTRTRPNDPDDMHMGWWFAQPGEEKSSPSGYGKFSFDDVTGDPVNGAKFVRDIYDMAGGTEGRYTVPILWDTKLKTIVNNSSPDIIVMLNNAFNEFAENPTLDLAPVELKDQMQELDDWIYDGINNGVYRCGFAKTQEAYDDAMIVLETAMDKLEAHLSDGRRFLTGDIPTLSDIRLFVTLIRYDEVYAVYFKCNSRLVRECPNIMRFCKNMWKLEGVKETTKMDHIKGHYYTSHPDLNTYAIIPKGTDFVALLDQ